MILALRFGSAGFGLPGLALPWAERRLQATELTVRLTQVPPSPAPEAVSPPVRLRLSQSLSLSTAKPSKPVPPSRADGSLEARLAQAKPPAQLSVPKRETRAPAPAARARAPDRKVRPTPRPRILAQRTPQPDTFKVPRPQRAEPEPPRAPESAAKTQTEEPAAQAAEPDQQRAVEEAARLQAEAAARQRAEDDARQRALALEKDAEAKKQADARRLEDAKKQDEARRQALELEARRVAEESARRETEELARQRALALQKAQEAKRLQDARAAEETRRQEEARHLAELKKQEETRRMTLEVEALKRAEDAARQQAAARQKEMEARREQEARRQAEEAAARAKEIAERQRADAQAAAQRERERLAALPGAVPAPGALSGRDLAAKALDQLRTPGAPRGDVLRPPSPPSSVDNPRRRSLFGVERDVGLRMYVDSWRWKIERGGAVNYRPSASWRAHDNPVVTVSIRSDGTLEDVLIHRSSGVRELDEAVRRIARLHAPYSAFPPNLARQYDVIEIRRVWSFENTLRILDEM